MKTAKYYAVSGYALAVLMIIIQVLRGNQSFAGYGWASLFLIIGIIFTTLSSKEPIAFRENKLALNAFIFGSVSFLLCWIPGLDIILGLVSVVLAIISLVRHQNKRLAIAGLVFGLIAIVLGSLTIAIAVQGQINNIFNSFLTAGFPAS